MNQIQFRHLFVSALIIITSAPVIQAETKDSLVIYAKLSQKKVYSLDDLKLSVNFRTISKTVIVVPLKPTWGFLKDSAAYILIDVQRKLNGIYSEVAPHGSIDYLPYADPLDSLKINSVRNYFFDLGNLYQMSKGEYRIRVLCLTSRFNKMRNLFSNWYYFEVVQTEDNRSSH